MHHKLIDAPQITIKHSWTATCVKKTKKEKRG